MRIIFSDHALLKIRQRKLSKNNILAVIAQPDYIGHAYGGREVLFRKFRRRSLKVIIVREHYTLVVITAHWVA